MSGDADILVYGCDFAGGNAGELAVSTLAQITGADIAASHDITGNEQLGGDWDLETTTGVIEAETLIAEASWSGTLATVTFESHEVNFSEISDDEKIDSTRSVGQEFKHFNGSGGNYQVEQIDLALRAKTGVPLQNIIVTIRENFDGPVLGSGSISSNQLLVDIYQWASIPLDAPLLLQSGQNYVIQVTTDDPSEKIEVGVEKDDDYPNGAFLNKDGNPRPDHDMLFRVSGFANSSPVIISDAGNGLFNPILIGENELLATTVVANDADLPNDSLSYSITGGAEASFFQIDSATGDLTLVELANFEDPQDVFKDNLLQVNVRATDSNGASDTQVLYVRITDANDLAIAVGNTLTTDEDTPIVIGQSFFTYTDEDGFEGVSATISNLNLAGGTLTYAGGTTVVLNGTTLTNAQLVDLTFTPAANSSANASFDYVVNDSESGVSAASINITVNPINDAPVILSNGGGASATLSVDEGQTDVTTVQASDAETPVENLTYSIVGGTDAALFQIDPLSGELSLIAPLDFEYPIDPTKGNDYLVDVQVEDGDGATDVQSLTVTISDVNDLPVASGNIVTTNEDTARTFAATEFTFTDVEGDALQSVTISGLNLAGGSLVYSQGTVANGTTISAADLATLVYTPAANSTATASFAYTVNDDDTGTDGATMTINVTPVNDLPVATGNIVTTNEDTARTFAATEFVFTDVEGDALQSVTISGLNLAGGSLVYSQGTVANGTTISTADLATLVFTPAANSTATASFAYTVNDDDTGTDGATMIVNVTPVNDLPVASGNIVTTNEDTARTFAATEFVFTDVEGDALQSVTISGLNLAGGSLVYSQGTVTSGTTISAADLATLVFTPAANSTATASFAYTVNDDDAGTDGATMTINVNSPSINLELETGNQPTLTTGPQLVPVDLEIDSLETELTPDAIDVSDQQTATAVVINPAATGSVEFAPANTKPAASTVQPAAEPIPIAEPAPASPTVDARSSSQLPAPMTTSIPGFEFRSLDTKTFTHDLDQTVDDIKNYDEVFGTVVSKVTFTFGSLLSVGGVTFVLRGGALFAAFLSALPAWNKFDPIAIVNGQRAKEENDEESDIDAMYDFVQDARSRVRKDSFL